MDGFTYRGVHCEELGCTYIPDASANWFASPDFDVSTDSVNWRDGRLYYYTRRKPRTFTLNCYFENITKAGREQIRRWLDAKTSGDLVFDERDYVKYKVRPGKYVQGKIYRQHEDYWLEDRYEGTFTITFEADDPIGYLTKLTDDDLLDTQHGRICNILPTSLMPAAPTASSRDFMILNQGTMPCHPIIRLAGTASNGLDILNNTNGDLCQ